MKKFLSLIIAVMFTLGLNAQTKEAPDFTATDYSGNEINLYEILEGGQYVLLHITTKNVSDDDDAQKVPSLVEAYKKLGCNQHDVFFIEALTNVLGDLAAEHVEEYGIEFPVIHNTESYGVDGPATDIMLQYGFPVTTVLIAPDKTVALEIETIETSEDIITALTPFGIKEYECGEDEGEEDTEGLTPIVEIEITDVTTTTVDVSFVPSAACATYFILIDKEGSMEQWATAFNVPLEQLIEMWSIERTGPSTHLWKELIPNTEYTVFVLSKDAEGNVIQLDKKKVTTEVLGGDGVSVVDLQVEVLTNTSVFVTATPNEETSEYHYILIEKLYADSIGFDSTMKILHADPYALYDVDRWEWMELNANTVFFAIAQGKNTKGEWGEITKVEFVTTVDEEGNIELVERSFSIYPNPVNDRLYIATETEVEEVVVYTITGVVVGQQTTVNGQQTSSIDVSNLNSGVYFVKVVTENGEVVKRFVKK